MRNINYYLYVGRLVPYKKVDLLVKVFNKLDKTLYIIGTGSEKDRLKSMAKNNIKFVGAVSDKELITYYKGAFALLMPQLEDFGIVSVEAQGFGVPVIAYGRGGALDTVLDGKTGVLFNEQNEKSLRDAIEKFVKMSFNKKTLIANAKRFSKETFKSNFSRKIRNHIG